jgi:hypothetical protein
VTPRVFGLFAYLGIEVRNFVFSGLPESLRRRGRALLLTPQWSEVLAGVARSRGIELVALQAERDLVRARRPIEGYLLASRRARLRTKGVKTFNLWGETQALRRRDHILGSEPVFRAFRALAGPAIRSHYYSDGVSRVFGREGLTDVVLQSYFTPENLTVATTAAACGVRTWVINWSWKDFFINEFIPFDPAGVVTWSAGLERLYRRFNDHIAPGRIRGVGNLSYDQMFEYVPRRPVEHYAEKYGFDPASRLAVYTLVHPRVCAHEEVVVEAAADELRQGFPDADVTLLVKPNPMDLQHDRFRSIARPGRVVILDSNWVYDRDNDFNMITEEGHVEWLDLLHHCSATVTVPSTVTVESLIMGRPVVNPLYGLDGAAHPEFERLYRAPHYAAAASRPDVLATGSPRETARALAAIARGEVRVQAPLDDIICGEGRSLDHLLAAMDEAAG